MRTYKFDTKISENGIIEIPPTPALFNKEVELTIVPKTKKSIKPNHKAAKFVRKWTGFFGEEVIEDSKYNYLMDKYT